MTYQQAELTTAGSVGRSDLETDALAAALEDANLPTLLMVLVYLTGDSRWLEPPYRPHRPRGLSDNDSAGLPAEVQAEVRAAALDAVLAVRRGELVPRSPDPTELAEMLSAALGEKVPRSYGPILAEEIGSVSRDIDPIDVRVPGFSVLVIGSGLSGLCMAIKCKEAGVAVTVIEKNPSVGGTWLENTYPGCGVDTPSHFYSFSFAPNPSWPHYFAKRPQVGEYLDNLAADYGINGLVRFNTEVVRAAYDAERRIWDVTCRRADGTEEVTSAHVLVSAVGMVNRPAVPALPGLENFTGPVMHTAQWRPDVDLAERRVAVIGTGASAMQLVPSIVDEVDRVTVFQRSKQWAVPHPNYHRPVSPGVRYLMEQVPMYGAFYRLRAFWNFSDRLHSALQIDPEWTEPARSINATNESHRVFLTNYIVGQLGDRTDLHDACIPEYPPYGKRPLIDNGWFRTMCRPDVELVTDPITEITASGVVTDAGKEYPADVLVLATGFRTLQFLWPMEIRGRSGRTLAETWGPEDARAYLGITVPDFPNFFIVNGPNTNAGHGGSAVISTELQVRYIMQAVSALASAQADSLEVREDAFWAYNDELDEALGRSIWVHRGMTTYYRNSAGRVVVSSPWTYLDFWGRMLRYDPSDYLTAPDSEAPGA